MSHDDKEHQEAVKLARELIDFASKPHPLEITPEDCEPDDEFTETIRAVRQNTIKICRALIAVSHELPNTPCERLGDPRSPAESCQEGVEAGAGTPRTDSLIAGQESRKAIYFPLRLDEMTELARQLERELAEANESISLQADEIDRIGAAPSSKATLAHLGPVTHQWSGPYHDRLEYFYADGKRITMEEVKGLLNAALSAPSATFTPVRLIRQKEANGCVVACMAMVSGKTYDEARADHIFSELADDAKGCSFREAEEYLWRHGFAWQEIYRCGPPGNTNKTVWPPAPWADVHVCEVRTGQAHAVVLLKDGSVLDPLCDEPKRLTDYAEVYSVRAVFKCGAASDGRTDG